MSDIKKAATVEAQAVSGEELVLINRQSLRELSAEAVYTFKLAACNNQVDRDGERFTDRALEQLAGLYVGRTVICDHTWSTSKQTARVYDAGVEDQGGGVKRLVLRCYMLRNERTAPVIDAIEGGILRECSVGCRTDKALCSVCGTDKTRKRCVHVPGATYGGAACHVDLDEATDAYEISFVAVPAQPHSGIVKAYGGEAAPAEDSGNSVDASCLELRSRQLTARMKMFTASVRNNFKLEE